MRRTWPTAAKILTGFFAIAMYAMPQGYTISAKPGAINYIEGNAFVNGRQISAKNLNATFLNANDTVSTDLGKVEVLLSPGVFLRLGDNTQVRMISPSLTDTQIEVKSGEAMIEADDISKESRISVINGGGTATIEKNGLYRFRASEPRSVAVLEGKAAVAFGERKSDIGKGRIVTFEEDRLKQSKFDRKQPDELYAWSNVRAEYNAASSYQSARDVNASSYGGAWGGFGFGGYSNPGWLWNSGLSSWAWLPGNSAYYSPFGYGFYGPGVVAYAPVVYAPVYGGGSWANWNRNRGGQAGGVAVASGRTGTPGSKPVPGARPITAAIPVNPGRPPAIGNFSNSLAANQAARAQATHSFAGSGGFRTATGMVVPAGRSGVMMAPGRSGGMIAPSGRGGGGPVAGGARSSGATSGARAGGSAGAAGGGAARSAGGVSHK